MGADLRTLFLAHPQAKPVWWMRRDVIASLKDKTGKTDKKITISPIKTRYAACCN